MVSDHKGINLPGVAVSVPAMSEKDIEDLRWGLRLGVDLVALSFVRSADDIERRAPDHGRGGRPRCRSSRRSRSRRRSSTSRRSSRRSTGSWSPAATSAWSCRSSRCRSCRSARSTLARDARQAGHRRDPDARVDDRRVAADPGRGLRRRQRGARRRRRADAVRRDQRSARYPVESVATMARIIAGGRGRRRSTQLPPLAAPPHTKAGAICRAPRSASARSVGAQLPGGVHRDRPLGAAAGAATARRSRCSRSRPNAGDPQPARAVLGRRDVPGRRTSSTPTTWCGRSTRRCSDIARCEVGEQVVIVAGRPPGIPGSTNALRVHRMGDAVGGAAPAYEQ